MYDDNYPTCAATYATLRIYRDDLDPDEISRRLNVAPSESQKKGEPLRPGRAAPVGGWFLSSKGRVESKDVRRHVVWVLDQLAARGDELLRLRGEGYKVDVSCYWLSAGGHGGPELDHEIMARLVSMGLDIWFDVYC